MLCKGLPRNVEISGSLIALKQISVNKRAYLDGVGNQQSLYNECKRYRRSEIETGEYPE